MQDRVLASEVGAQAGVVQGRLVFSLPGSLFGPAGEAQARACEALRRALSG